ncbi:MAG: hypothetical protein JRI70_03270 [Deltaproteobacteria bacterium]|nr:hypothetical protein [Deltaproteobacteria bacterium]
MRPRKMEPSRQTLDRRLSGRWQKDVNGDNVERLPCFGQENPRAHGHTPQV